MAADELHFHRQRDLPRWERLGHPLDTLTVVVSFGWLLAVQPSPSSLGVYAGLSIFSCLFVTKDELVHGKHCRPAVSWLHALLFTLHPLVLLSAGLLWPAWHQQALPFIRYTGFERWFLLGNTLLTLAFGLYQLVYWNFSWQSAKSQKAVRSTTPSTIN